MDEFMQKAISIAGSKRKLAKALGVSLTSVVSWSKGFQPKEENKNKVETYIKGKST